MISIKILCALMNGRWTAQARKTSVQQIRNSLKNYSVVPVMLVILCMLVQGRIEAQNFTTLYSFSGGGDGANPYAALLLSSNTLYGTAYSGGDSGAGAVFALNTDGTGFTTLYSFTGGSDGANPHGALILSGKTLYGTAAYGGTSNNGTVFALNTDGSGFTTLHTFSGTSDGALPDAGLVLSGNTLYGTTSGTVFKVNADGTGFTTLHAFTGGSDGSGPGDSGLILSSNSLYGTASAGGSSGNGTVFKVNTDGTGFATVHSFTGRDGTSPNGLILSGVTLYGTAGGGGISGNGTVFALNTDGTSFTTLHNFTGGSDGRLPLSPLLILGNILYGAALYAGSSGSGTIFAIHTDGTGFKTAYNFTALNSSSSPAANNDGGQPRGGLISSGSTLFGTAQDGGTSGYGTVFSISLPATPPQLTISPVGANVVLAWSTNAIGFTLQSTTNLASPVWATNSAVPVVINGLNAITNSISNAQQFYRLTQ